MNGIGSFIAILYLLIIIQINYIEITNMANNDSKLRMAFEFKAISYKISKIGLKNLIIWYMAIMILSVIIYLYPN